MNVTLTKAIQPDKRITAIKDLRNATRDKHGNAMSLREAKDIVFALIDQDRPAVVDVLNPSYLLPSFEWIEQSAEGVSRESALDFLLAVATIMTPHQMALLGDTDAYKSFREAL